MSPVAIQDTTRTNRLIAINANSTHILEGIPSCLAESMSFDVRLVTSRTLLLRRRRSNRRCNWRLRRLMTSEYIRRTPTEKGLHRRVTEGERRHNKTWREDQPG